MPRIGDMKISKFLKRSDLGPDDEIIFTVKGVSEENAGTEDHPDIKWALNFREIPKPMILNWTNMQLLERALGSDNSDDWIGKRIKVWFDESVQFKGEMKGGLRIKKAPGAGQARGRDDSGDPPQHHDERNDRDDDDIPF